MFVVSGLAAANVLSFLGAVVTVFETHDENFSRKGGGLGADLATLQDIRQCDEVPLRLKDGGPGTYFYGDLWKVHMLVTSGFFTHSHEMRSLKG